VARRQGRQVEPDLIAWVIDQIKGWRAEAGIRKKPDAARLATVVEQVTDLGLPQLEVVFGTLASEWLLRARRTREQDVKGVLARIETSLEEILPPDLAYLVTETLGPGVGRRLRAEGRTLVALGTYLPQPQFVSPVTGSQRSRAPVRIVTTQRGPCPWPAPWVAGLVLHGVVARKKRGALGLAIDLVSSLLGAGQIADSRDFRRIRARLKGPSGEFARQVADRSAWHRSDAPTDEWRAVLVDRLTVLGPKTFFPSDPEVAQALFAAYGWSGSLRGQSRARESEQ
jgi:hypothetical protein